MKGNKQAKTLGPIKSFLFDLCIAVIIVLVMNGFLVQNLRVQGKSMFPLLDNGDMVLINKIAYTFSNPQIGDVIGFYNEKLGQKVVKRIVGTPGDQIDFRNNMVYINNEPIIMGENASIKTRGDIKYPYTVPENSYFVMGDNYDHSIDSRFHFIGAVKKQEIIGRIDFRIWPFWQNPLLKTN